MDLFSGGMALASGIGNLWGAISAANVNQQNVDAQKDNLDWQKKMQRESWARDDTAVQRRAADMSAAGFNPLLAAGSAAGNAPVVSTSAPRSDPAAVAGPGRAVSSAAEKAMAFQSMSKDFAVKDAQAQLLQAQTAGVNAETEYKRSITPGAADLQSSQTDLNRMSTVVNQANNMFKLAELNAFKRDANFVIETGLKMLKTDNERHEFQLVFERTRKESVEALVKAGIDHEVAQAIAAQYAAQIAKNELDVSTSTVPAHIAGAYADVAGKVVGAGSNTMNLATYTNNFLKQFKKE